MKTGWLKIIGDGTHGNAYRANLPGNFSGDMSAAIPSGADGRPLLAHCPVNLSDDAKVAFVDAKLVPDADKAVIADHLVAAVAKGGLAAHEAETRAAALGIALDAGLEPKEIGGEDLAGTPARG